ncbi:MAG TPA: hypothetical protein VGD72_08320 [Mycobacteriales bacterium]|jgi:hypothetical protein
MHDQARTSAPTGVGEEVATGAADESAGDEASATATDPARAAASVDPRDDRGEEAAAPEGATSASPRDDAGGGDVTGSAADGERRTGEGLPGLATGTAGGNGIGDSGEGSAGRPVDPEDTGTR